MPVPTRRGAGPCQASLTGGICQLVGVIPGSVGGKSETHPGPVGARKGYHWAANEHEVGGAERAEVEVGSSLAQRELCRRGWKCCDELLSVLFVHRWVEDPGSFDSAHTSPTAPDALCTCQH